MNKKCYRDKERICGLDCPMFVMDEKYQGCGLLTINEGIQKELREMRKAINAVHEELELRL